MVVRIPRRTAPPASAVPLAPAPAPPVHESSCWQNFADGSDDEAPASRSEAASGSEGLSDDSLDSQTFAPVAEGGGGRGRRRSSVGGFMTTPDGIQILVTDTNGVAESRWQSLMEDDSDGAAAIDGTPGRSLSKGSHACAGGASGG